MIAFSRRSVLLGGKEKMKYKNETQLTPQDKGKELRPDTNSPINTTIRELYEKDKGNENKVNVPDFYVDMIFPS